MNYTSENMNNACKKRISLIKTNILLYGIKLSRFILPGLVFNLLLVFSISATPGDLDSTFDKDGIVTTDFNAGQPDFCNSVAIQPDGKIICGGQTLNSGTSYDFALIRYNPDGSLDATFGNVGKV